MFEEKRFHSGGRSAVYYTLIKFLNGIIPSSTATSFRIRAM